MDAKCENMLLQVKAWCYYESRLLGAHHSLLSTYALETMVLYIFNMYVEELSSPLKVCRASRLGYTSLCWRLLTVFPQDSLWHQLRHCILDTSAMM